ncbi:MAG: ribonuclease HI [Clostridia bacterium]|nr:ribonuclease HI [Clostridia bacterium]
MKEIAVYTDGACSGNPGPGGWACVLMYGEHVKELSGYEPETTNNRMEMLAAIEALKKLKEPCSVTIHSDSAYLVNAINQRWINNWLRNGWKTSTRQPVENQDLWRELLVQMNVHKVTFVKVKGHANNRWNNRCDELAVGQVKRRGKPEGPRGGI